MVGGGGGSGFKVEGEGVSEVVVVECWEVESVYEVVVESGGGDSGG